MKYIFYGQGHSGSSGSCVLGFIRQVAEGECSREKFKEYTEYFKEKERCGEDKKLNIMIYEDTEVFLDMADDKTLLKFYKEMI